MQRVLVVLGVTSPEVDVTAPTQKAKQAQKKIVEKLRFEDRVMAQFVRGVEQKDVKRAVGQQRRQQQIESILHLPSEHARENDQSEVPKRLQKPLPVAAPIQLAHLLARQRRSIPRHRSRTPFIFHTQRSLFPSLIQHSCGSPVSNLLYESIAQTNRNRALYLRLFARRHVVYDLHVEIDRHVLTRFDQYRIVQVDSRFIQRSQRCEDL